METQQRKPKKKPSKLEEMTKEQIRQAILKKRECNAKAQAIVENLLEKGVSEVDFIQCLPDINQSHFEDIVEERAITQLCGYPICSNSLSRNEIPKQKYRISTRTNKVYDITARKSFCSNQCYHAAMHIKHQMLTSPLWFREHQEIPVFDLLRSPDASSLGREIDVSLVERIHTESNVHLFTSINDFTAASLKDVTGESEHDDDNNTDNPKKIKLDKEEQHEPLSKPFVTPVQGVDNADKEYGTKPPQQFKEKQQDKKKKAASPLNIVGEIIERPEQKIDPILTDTVPSTTSSQKDKPRLKVSSKKQLVTSALTIEIEKCLSEWVTIDTLLFLFSEERVKEMVADKGDGIKEYLNNYAKGIFYTSNSYDHYQALCRKLNMLELEDKQYDTETLNRKLKPLPDYSILQEEGKKIQLKVRAFYSGETEIPDVQPEGAQCSTIEEDSGKDVQLPLVDKHAQNALRRRIVGQHLDRVLPDLLRSLGLLTLSVSSDVHLLVNSFKLKANNIMFEPIQWTLIAIVIIKLLSLRDQRLACLLEQPTAHQHMQLLLLSYKQDGGYLDRLISWLTDIDRLLDTNDAQLTSE